MNRHRVVIAEDEPLARDGMAEWVGQIPGLELVGTCADGNAALRAIRDLEPALVLMDIQMPGLNGLQVLRALAAEAPARRLPAVIFTTAYDEHAVAAFELHAVDYLLKPFAQERFEEAVRHALAAGASGERTLPALEAAAAPTAPLTRLLVRDQGKIFPLQVGAIEHLRSDTKYTAIVSKGRSYLVRLPLSEFERRLSPDRFLRISRSCIVNLDFVVAMVPNENSQLAVQLQDGTRVIASRDVSRQLRADLL
jgi:two-component system LytT family response regulator